MSAVDVWTKMLNTGNYTTILIYKEVNKIVTEMKYMYVFIKYDP